VDPCGLNGPLTTNKVSKDNSIKINADLTKLTTAPVNASFESDFKTTIDQTFQAVPDKVAACRIMLLEVSCIVVNRQDPAANDLADKLVSIVAQQHVCSDEQTHGLRSALKSQ
jgi:hypothetical protein